MLVVRTDEIGDLVLMSAFLRELRANLPSAWITLVVKTGALGLSRHCPHVNEVIGYEWEGSPKWGAMRRLLSEARFARSKLLPRRFDLALLPRWNSDYYGASHLAYLSGAARRVAYSEKVSRVKARFNRGFDRLFTDLLTDDTSKHEVERNLAVLQYLGGTVSSDALELWTSREDAHFAADMIRDAGISSQDLIVALGVGSRGPRKTWPAENFLAVARWLRDARGARVIIVGDRTDVASGQRIADALGGAAVNLAGRTSLGQLAEVLKRASLFIGNDSGPKHIAAAAGVPVVEISWHPRSARDIDESPAAFGPWRTPSQVLQPERALDPCDDTCRSLDAAHCITQVSVEQVTAAAAALLDLAGSAR